MDLLVVLYHASGEDILFSGLEEDFPKLPRVGELIVHRGRSLLLEGIQHSVGDGGKTVHLLA